MGPAAWAAVGRALILAGARSAIFGDNGAVALLAREIRKEIFKGEIQVAEAMLRDLSCRHRAMFEEFARKYKDDLPDEFMQELGL